MMEILQHLGRLYLQDTVINSPVYWKGKRLDVQAIVARRGPPTLFVTVTMNVWREEMHRIGLDNEHTGAFTPQADKPRPFDRPDVVARVCNQYSHAVMHQLEKKSKYIFGLRCIAIGGKLEFQERNTPHHHILLWMEGGVLEDIGVINNIIKAELPRPGEDDELRALVKTFNMHRHSPYFRRRSGDNSCRFG